jgi:hypothetical protein
MDTLVGTQQWVQLTPYLQSAGSVAQACGKKGLACRPLRKVDGRGPATVRELIEGKLGPFTQTSSKAQKLKLLLRMSQFKDVHKTNVRVMWKTAQYRFANRNNQARTTWRDFHAQYGTMTSAQFGAVLAAVDSKSTYQDPKANTVQQLLRAPIPANTSNVRTQLVSRLPIRFTPNAQGTLLPVPRKAQVFRDQNGKVVTRAATAAEIRDGKRVHAKSLTLTLLPRMQTDPDYVAYKGKWVLWPLNGRMDPMAEGEVVGHALDLQKAKDVFAGGVHVQNWKQYLQTVRNNQIPTDAMRLYTPWGGILHPQDTKNAVPLGM